MLLVVVISNIGDISRALQSGEVNMPSTDPVVCSVCSVCISYTVSGHVTISRRLPSIKLLNQHETNIFTLALSTTFSVDASSRVRSSTYGRSATEITTRLKLGECNHALIRTPAN